MRKWTFFGSVMSKCLLTGQLVVPIRILEACLVNFITEILVDKFL